jgi:hypothetical protein
MTARVTAEILESSRASPYAERPVTTVTAVTANIGVFRVCSCSFARALTRIPRGPEFSGFSVLPSLAISPAPEFTPRGTGDLTQCQNDPVVRPSPAARNKATAR